MPLRIAFDVDGVVADMESELVRQAQVLFGTELVERLSRRNSGADTEAAPESAGEASSAIESVADTPPRLRLNMTMRQQRRLWQHIETIDNFWETLDESEPGAIARLATLAEQRHWEVIFLTKRPRTAGATAQIQTQRWLRSKGFAMPSVFVVRGSRGRIAAALDLHVVVDDRPENCLDVVVDSTARAVLVWRDDQSHLPAAARRLGISVATSVGECLDVLSQADKSPADGPGMINRVRRLFGLKPAGRADSSPG